MTRCYWAGVAARTVPIPSDGPVEGWRSGSLADAVRREAMEEAGVRVTGVPRLVCVSNVVEYGRHYLALEFGVTEFSGEPTVREPDLIESWQWYPLDELPDPLFKPRQLALASLHDSRLLNDA
ncbi:NUDIX domain-containing protein [Plantactinospora endophytica]|uniref:NUDIX domain-containing protein n=1 Tax=Plantactinospora endophytica TaxID=673535 RepID=UPI001945656F|nr:NUDIX domain-containing protein [Plantactinospora endophytica]